MGWSGTEQDQTRGNHGSVGWRLTSGLISRLGDTEGI
jgi:hypothetical protein